MPLLALFFFTEFISTWHCIFTCCISFLLLYNQLLQIQWLHRYFYHGFSGSRVRDSLAGPLLRVSQATVKVLVETAVSSEAQGFLPSSCVSGLRPSSSRSHQVPFHVALSIGSQGSLFLQGQQESLPCVCWQDDVNLCQNVITGVNPSPLPCGVT